MLISAMLVVVFRIPMFSQASDTVGVARSTRNSIGFQISFHEFFAHYATVPSGDRILIFALKPSFGLEYTRQRPNKDLWAFSAKFYPLHEYKFDPNPPCTRDGQIIWRRMGLLQADYLRHLISRKKASLFATIGLNFRYGSEYVASCIPRWYGEPDDIALRNIGIAVGMRGNIPIGRRIQFSGGLKFTEYLYRRFHGIDPWYTNWAKHGSTRHMLTVQLGVGYRFWK
jgi:hypothetical protein